jgi:hypothetical protein
MLKVPAHKIWIAVAVVLVSGALAYYDVRLNREQTKVAQLQAENVAQAQQARLDAVPVLPVSVSFHRALLGGKSYVAEFSSLGQGDMAVAVEWVDAATHNRRVFRVDVGPGRPTARGHLEGFDFEPGDSLTLSHDGFKSVAFQVL